MGRNRVKIRAAWWSFIFFLLCFCQKLTSLQTIEEKKEALTSGKEQKELLTFIHELNKRLCELRAELKEKHEIVNKYHHEGAEEKEFQNLLSEVNRIRSALFDLEKEWHTFATQEGKKEDEGYALWDQEETTLSQLIMEYGSADYLYIIPPEIFPMKIHMHSSIPIPRESWNYLLEIVLSQNGVGIKQLNPYTRQLYILKQGLIAVDSILNSAKELVYASSKSRIAYIFTPPPERVRSAFQFFEKFRDPKSTFIYQVGYKITIISYKEEIEKLLTLYETVWEKENEKVARILTMGRIPALEMEKILRSYFEVSSQKMRVGLSKGEGDDFTIFPLKEEGALVLVGPKDLVERAERLVEKAQDQIEDPMEMTIFSYTCRHSDPSEVAEVLEKVYTSLITSGVPRETAKLQNGSPLVKGRLIDAETGQPAYGLLPHPSRLLAAPNSSAPPESRKEKDSGTSFIPFPKTGTITMVVRRDSLPKIKNLLRKLDVPKKMVKIEVLLFEKRSNHENSFGLNLLRFGDAASNTHMTGLNYAIDAVSTKISKHIPATKRGIVDFFLFRKKSKHSWPAFDIAYNFLISQEDVRVHAAPSVTTLNQTAAHISLVDEISISNGVAPIKAETEITYKESFSREDYGTKLTITPTIHEPEFSDEDTRYVSLETSIKFDTIKKGVKGSSRPDVFKRQIENQVCVADGETVVLGGLRKKAASDSSKKIPFIGEIPGLGKFFSDSQMNDEETEMFICITPKVIFDEKGNLEKILYEQLIERPGDLYEFLKRIEKAKAKQKRTLFDKSFKLFFGKVK